MLQKVFAVLLVYVYALVFGVVSLPSHFPSRQPTLKIINGHDAGANVHPFMVRLESRSSYCGGSLISSQHVLTAAHCLSGVSSVNAILGAHNHSADESSQQVEYSVNFKLHPNYTQNPTSHDIAIAKLARPVALNQYVKVVKLPPRSAVNDTQDFYANKSARVFGWGRTQTQPTIVRPDILQALEVKVLSTTDRLCYIYQVPKDALCVTRDSAGKGNVCSGDSGGPLMSNGIQIGVVHGHIGNPCEISEVAQFPRIDWHLDWIHDTMANM